MPMFLAGLFALYLLLAAIRQFGRLTPADAARLMRKGGVAMGVLSFLLMLLRGRFGLMGALVSAALGMAIRNSVNPFTQAFRSAGVGTGRISTVRSATIEMTLDHGTGAVEGEVFAGPYQGRPLNALPREHCLRLYKISLSEDPEGATLLETYLDRRFPGWRNADEGQAEPGGRAWSSGTMTRDEAYEILGLPKGAGAEEIIRSHRALMKKLHPDHGGSTALAARVNQAKDVLLGRHG
jgi:hypothetical protein